MQSKPKSTRSSPTGLLRRLNRVAVLDYIRRNEATTPTSISQDLELSPPTVMRVIDALIKENLVAHDGYEESSGGRPRARVKFSGASHAVIGIEATKDSFRGAVTDLDGHIQVEHSIAACEESDKNVAVLIDLIRKLQATPRPAGQKLIGIGVGVPSIVRQPEGEVVLTLGLGWQDLPLQSILASTFDLPVIVENDRNLAALGEWGFGIGQGKQSVVSLAIVPGAGTGIVMDGRLLRGRSNAAGEVSWFLDDPAFCGRTFKHLGGKDQLRFGGISGEIVDQLAELNKAHARGDYDLNGLFNADPDGPFGAVCELLEYTAIAVSSLSTYLNPELIVLNGGVAQGEDLTLAYLNKCLLGNIFEVPTLVTSKLGYRDVILGAIHAVLDATILDPGYH